MRRFLVLVSCLAGTVQASVDFSGSASAELRWFPSTPAVPGQSTGLQPSLAAEPEFRWSSESGEQRFTFHPFGRFDALDDKRTHWDLREAYFLLRKDSWDLELLVGINVVFWGVTESRHLVNIINQDDLVENIDQEDKLGQPMLQLSWYSRFGTYQVFLMPGFRQRTFPGGKGRLRPPLPVDYSVASFGSSWNEGHPDCALRYSNAFADWDIGVQYFYGHSREPLLLVNEAMTALVPHYDLIHQVGTDIQYTQGSWLLKAEAILRQGQGPVFAALVAGFEHTFYQIFQSSADLGALMEVLWDGRSLTEAPITPLENDLFVGARLGLNDVQDTQVLCGTSVDFKYGDFAVFLEGSRRLGDSWKLTLEARIFWNVNSASPLFPIRRDDLVDLHLSYYW